MDEENKANTKVKLPNKHITSALQKNMLTFTIVLEQSSIMFMLDNNVLTLTILTLAISQCMAVLFECYSIRKLLWYSINNVRTTHRIDR